jgi:flagellar hook-basal body complex protein FliE
MEDVARFFANSVPQHRHPNPFPAVLTPPQLVILGQKTHSEETVTKNGIQRTVLVVVKNSPFHFQIGVTGSTSKVDFNQIAFDSFLQYDCEGNKEVDYVKVKPIEFKPTPSENGLNLEVELRIKVLTSQHEDMLFKVRIQGYHPITREEIAGMCLLTAPIKVISKPEQLKKRQPSKKRTLTDLLVDTVSRIEKKQEEQQRLIERMLTQQSQPVVAQLVDKRQKGDNSPAPTWEEYTPSQQPEQSTQQFSDKAEAAKENQLPEFEDAFGNLLKAYTSMKAEEKPETIRKLIRNSNGRDTERLSELLDLFWTEGLQKEPSFGGINNRDRFPSAANPNKGEEEGCSCSDCPHKLELDRIDEFYKEFLSSGATPSTFQ